MKKYRRPENISYFLQDRTLLLFEGLAFDLIPQSFSI